MYTEKNFKTKKEFKSNGLCSRIEGVLMTVTGMTRKDYMENRITHLEYYGNVARIAGIRFSEEFLTRCDKALTAGDEHLNTVPLSTWDMMGAAWRVRIASALKQVNNTGGVSLSDLVCTLKSAAIIWRLTMNSTLASQAIIYYHLTCD